MKQYCNKSDFYKNHTLHKTLESIKGWGFPGGAVVENLPANAGDTGSSPGREDPTCHGAARPVSHNY